MYDPKSQRRQIENNILSLARSVNTNDNGWLESDSFSALMSAWRELARYYDRSGDTNLDSHVLRQYMRYAVKLRAVAADERLSTQRRQQAKKALRDLNTKLDTVFRNIERNTPTAV